MKICSQRSGGARRQYTIQGGAEIERQVVGGEDLLKRTPQRSIVKGGERAEANEEANLHVLQATRVAEEAPRLLKDLKGGRSKQTGRRLL